MAGSDGCRWGAEDRKDSDKRLQSNVGDKHRCKTVLLQGTALVQKLCSVIRSVDWTRRFGNGDNPVRQCQEAYRELHTWLYTEAGDLSKTSAKIQLGDSGSSSASVSRRALTARPTSRIGGNCAKRLQLSSRLGLGIFRATEKLYFEKEYAPGPIKSHCT
eukprot:COSAG02_NODE_5572_length_4221_cov_6.487142_3_plen_160_part_00